MSQFYQSRHFPHSEPPLPAGYNTYSQPIQPHYVESPKPYQQPQLHQPQQPQTYYEQPAVAEKPIEYKRPAPVSQPKPVTPNKHSYIIDWIVCFLPIIFIIAMLICSAALLAVRPNYENPTGAHSTLQRLENNLKLIPVVDIVNPTAAAHTHMLHHFMHTTETAAAELKCPEGFNKAAVGTWEGVNSGCLCDDGEVKSRAYCYAHFTSDKCKSVKKHDAQALNVWKEKWLCIKSAQQWKWVAGTDCPTGEKKCSGNICIPSAHPCPLSALVKDVQTATSVQIGTFHFKKVNEGGHPIVDFEIIPGVDKSLCFNNGVRADFESKLYYPLSKTPQKGCDEYGTLKTYSAILDTGKEEVVAEQNDLDDIYETIPFYDDYQDEDDSVSLQTVQRIEIKNQKECASIHPEEVGTLTTKSNTVHDYTSNMAVIIITVCIIVVVMAPILYLVRKRTFTTINMNEHHQPKFYVIAGVIVAALCIVLGVIYITQVDGDNGLVVHRDKFQTYRKHECFIDRGLIKAVEQVEEFAFNSYSSSQGWVKVAFYTSIIFVVLIIVCLVYQSQVHGELFANPWSMRQLQHFQF